MDIERFLDRVVAPGNFIAVATGNYNRYRFFDRSRPDLAAAYIERLTQEGKDTWYGVAAFQLAQTNDRGELEGKRDQDNVHMLRALWIDLDCKRDGDGKLVGKNVFADIPEAARWFQGFLISTKLPAPNLVVNSGYGLHIYWILETPLSPEKWRPYAHALRQALVDHQATMDTSVTIDSARILRIPSTFNLKVSAHPAPVTVRFDNQADIQNEVIYGALQPYMGQVSQTTSLRSGTGNLTGSPPAVIQMRQGPSQATQNAQNISRREYLFSEIATKCKQVELSLSTGGLGDLYPLWYLGHISLASFCSDGATWAHEIGKTDPRYTTQGTDNAFAQAQREQVTRHTGAPTCGHYQKTRPGVCQTCPHFGRLNSPISLGTEEPDGDLPEHYFRRNGSIWRKGVNKEGKAATIFVVNGDVYSPTLDKVGDDRKITFNYDKAGSVSSVACLLSEVPVDARGAIGFFGRQGVGLFDNAKEFGRFVMAWIDRMRDLRAERADPSPPFGWAVKSNGTYAGFGFGGVLFRPDGSEEPAPGGDPELTQLYKPKGTLAEWRAACDFVTKGRVDLQVLVAASFASPLVEFTGLQGVVMSMWSRSTALGKSSAMQAGMSVWADPRAMFNFDDTINSVHYRIGRTKVMPAYWDEIRVNKDSAGQFIDTLFKLGQGKDKARLNSDSSLKVTGDWKTMLITSGNRPLMDYIVREKADTDAGAVRLFEICLDHPQLNLNPAAQQIIAQCGKNSGNAGRVYAKWLGQNATAAQKFVTDKQMALGNKLQANQGERFYITTIATLLVGGAIANFLGLGNFDIPGMEKFLVRAFTSLRQGRTVNLPVANGMFDCHQVLGEFVSAFSSERMLQPHMPRSGKKTEFARPLWSPTKPGGRTVVEIFKRENVMRINKSVFDKWLYGEGKSFSDVTYQMEQRWRVKHGVGVLGAGSQWATGRVAYVEIALPPGTDLGLYNYETRNMDGP